MFLKKGEIMSINMPQIAQPRFIREMQGAGASHGIYQSYANINDIANLKFVGNYWEAGSLSHQKNPDGSDVTYHFDNNGASQILNYLA